MKAPTTLLIWHGTLKVFGTDVHWKIRLVQWESCDPMSDVWLNVITSSVCSKQYKYEVAFIYGVLHKLAYKTSISRTSPLHSSTLRLHQRLQAQNGPSSEQNVSSEVALLDKGVLLCVDTTSGLDGFYYSYPRYASVHMLKRHAAVSHTTLPCNMWFYQILKASVP